MMSRRFMLHDFRLMVLPNPTLVEPAVLAAIHHEIEGVTVSGEALGVVLARLCTSTRIQMPMTRECAEIERLTRQVAAIDWACQMAWASNRERQAEIDRLRSERSYVVGFNDGFETAERQLGGGSSAKPQGRRG